MAPSAVAASSVWHIDVLGDSSNNYKMRPPSSKLVYRPINYSYTPPKLVDQVMSQLSYLGGLTLYDDIEWEIV